MQIQFEDRERGEDRKFKGVLKGVPVKGCSEPEGTASKDSADCGDGEVDESTGPQITGRVGEVQKIGRAHV